jgi:hypothetical protein
MPDIWCFYHVKNCPHTRPIPKDKFVAIVCRDSYCLGFLVNTNIHPFIRKQPDLLVCQVKIRASNYRFLDYDSYIDCNDLYPFGDTLLLDSRGLISRQTKIEIIKAVSISKTIEGRYQKLILGSS